MVAIGIAMVWAGYSLVLFAYITYKRYNITFADMFRTEWPPNLKQIVAE